MIGRAKAVRESRLDYLYKLHLDGVPLLQPQMKLLIWYGYLSDDYRKYNNPYNVLTSQFKTKYDYKRDRLGKKTEAELSVDKHVRISKLVLSDDNFVSSEVKEFEAYADKQ